MTRLFPLLFIVWVIACGTENENRTIYQTPEAISLFGDSLYPRILPTEVERDFKRKLTDTRMEAKANPDSEIALIWYGRRLAYLGHFQKAIEVYTNALEKHPESFRILRHRGHRYITTRQFDRAIADLSRAAVLSEGTNPQIEPDGIPNKLNRPLTTTQWNIYYHLGLAYYLANDMKNALDAFTVCYNTSDNDDILIAATDWLYIIQNKLGNEDEALKLLEQIPLEPEIIENDSYLNRINLYKGILTVDEVLKINGNVDDGSVNVATQGYGVGNWYLNNGDTTSAIEIFQQVTSGDNWPAFGYIASEAELERLTK